MQTPDDYYDAAEEVSLTTHSLANFLEEEGVKCSVAVLSMLILAADIITDHYPEKQDKYIRSFLRFLEVPKNMKGE